MAELTGEDFKKWTAEEEARFEFLDALRESGATNMFGAAPYLQDAFGLSKSDARATLSLWMKTFGERHPEGSE